MWHTVSGPQDGHSHYIKCPENHYITEMRCKGDYCSVVEFKCGTSPLITERGPASTSLGGHPSREIRLVGQNVRDHGAAHRVLVSLVGGSERTTKY